MVLTDNEGNIIPGLWWEDYFNAWRKAFPTHRIPGGFRRYDGKWATVTPEWDAWWFKSQGVTPPEMVNYAMPVR